MSPLSWGESWLEHCQTAICIHALNRGELTREDLRAIRTRLRKAIVELDREIAAAPLREVR